MRGFSIDERHRSEYYKPVAEKIAIGALVGFTVKGKQFTAKVLRQAWNGNIDATLNGKEFVLVKTKDGWKQLGKIHS